MTSAIKTQTEVVIRDSPKAELPRVLLVEDEKPIRDIIVPWLFRDGFDLREAADGQAAIELLETATRINLVLSNMLLPLVDGFALLLHVKQYYPRIPFAFITAIHDAQLRDAAFENGADGFLLKPFSEQQFLELVRSTIAKPPRR